MKSNEINCPVGTIWIVPELPEYLIQTLGVYEADKKATSIWYIMDVKILNGEFLNMPESFPMLLCNRFNCYKFWVTYGQNFEGSTYQIFGHFL